MARTLTPKSTPTEVLAANLAGLREHFGLTQYQVASDLGVAQATVSAWEQGNCAPMLDRLVSLADYYETSVDMLVGHGTDKRTRWWEK